jgi:hypothetical protein
VFTVSTTMFDTASSSGYNYNIATKIFVCVSVPIAYRLPDLPSASV